MDSQRRISYESGQKLGIKNGAEFHEVSSKSGDGVKELFDSMANKLMDQSKMNKFENV